MKQRRTNLGIDKKMPVAALCLMLCLLSPPAAQAKVTTLGGPPEGFENLDAPRRAAVTVYYGGQLLGNFLAHITPSTLQFDEPGEIIEAIPAISDREKVFSILVRPMPSNAGRLCKGAYAADCGTLRPDIAGVIFDESRLHAELFMNKDMLSVTDASGEQYLPLPERKFSSVLGFGGAINGSGDAPTSYALTSESVYSYGEANLTTRTSYTNNGARFDTVAANIERRGWNGTAGLFRSRAMNLVGDRDIGGVSVSTSERTIIDGRKTDGNDIIVYLPRRSFVSILREGRIYSSRAYEAGNQRVDTSELPDGAYMITLKIEEVGGEVREEERFFAKTQEIPPPGRPVYYAEAGVIRKPPSQDEFVPVLTRDPIMRAGTVRRINENTGIGISAFAVRDRVAMETDLYRVDKNRRMRISAMGSSAGDYGVAASLAYERGKLSGSIDARRLWQGKKADKNYDGLFGAYTQGTMNVGYALRPDVTLGVRGSYASLHDGSRSTISYGPAAEWRIWQKGESALTFNADAVRSNNRNEANIGLRFTRRVGKYGLTGAAAQRVGGDKPGSNANTRLWYENLKPGEIVRAAIGANAEKSTQTINADAEWRNRFGQLRGSMQKTLNDGFSYGGSFSFNAAQRGVSMHVGGSENDSSAIIIKVNGNAKTKMKIFVNGAELSSVAVGGQQVLYLSPFHVYRLRLEPETPGLFAYDTNDRAVTLYPGNVSTQEWDIKNFYVVAARIEMPDGMPLTNAILKESREQVITGSNGWVQAELTDPSTMTFIMENEDICQTKMPPQKNSNGIYIYNKPLTCTPIN